MPGAIPAGQGRRNLGAGAVFDSRFRTKDVGLNTKRRVSLESLVPSRAIWRPGLVLSGVGLIVAVSVSTSMLVAQRWRAAERELATAHDILSATTEMCGVAYQEFDEAVSQIAAMADGNSLDAASCATLQQARAFFEQFLEIPSPVTHAQARAYHCLGDIERLLRQFDRAEAAYLRELAMLDEMLQGSHDLPLQGDRASAAVTLGAMLAVTGRLGEAQRFTQQAVQVYQSRSAAQAAGPYWLALDRAIACRNLALIEAAMGGFGVEHAQRAANCELPPDAILADQILQAEFLVDAQNVHAWLLARQGNWPAAEAACQAGLGHIERLLGELRLAAERQTIGLRPSRYRKARTRLEFNLNLVRATAAEDWKWQPLLDRCLPLVPADVLVQGRIPAEFEPQQAILLAWIDEQWADATIVEMIVHLHPHVPVHLLVADEANEAEARAALLAAHVNLDQVHFSRAPTDTLWVRDYGPQVVETSLRTQAVVDLPLLRGERSFADIRNDRVPTRWAQARTWPVIRPSIFLEGGHLISNGAGLCVVSQDVLQENAELGLSEPHVTATLRRLYGAERIVYLEPLQGEPTGHVDWFATFTAPDTIVIGDYRGLDLENAARLDRHAAALAKIDTPQGPLKVERLPMPPRSQDYFGGTYTNVVYGNEVVLIPTWPEASAELEQRVWEIYARLLPGRRLVGVPATKLAVNNGALRCAALNLYRVDP